MGDLTANLSFPIPEESDDTSLIADIANNTIKVNLDYPA